MDSLKQSDSINSLRKLFIFTIIMMICICGCTKTKTEEKSNLQKETPAVEVKKMDYIEKNQIENELVKDCPEEAMALRSRMGKVDHVTYYSNTCKMERAFSILFPPNYDNQKKYPVMYFQHGIFGDENCMINDATNKFREITGNLVADGFAKEMIIVFGNMYASDDPSLKPGFTDEATKPYDNFINELVNDLMPYIESHYPVLTGRKNTAICGFSMGGRESLYIGLQRPDLFGYICAIAPAPGLVSTKDWAMTHKGMLDEADVKFKDGAELPEVFMVCCGTRDGTVGQYPKSYHNILKNNGVEHIWFEVADADHNNIAIRSGFYQFIQRIF